MIETKRVLGMVGAVLLAAAFAGCSASSDSGLKQNPTTGAGGSIFGSSGGAANAGGLPDLSNGGSFVVTPRGGDGSTLDGGANTNCNSTAKPEEIIQYAPVGIFIMQDRSSSMVGLAGDPNSWPNSQAAVTGFVNDPASAGISVGLGSFPTLTGSADCAGTDCGTPIVPIAALPGNAQAMVAGMQSATPTTFPPLLTPTECALRGMIAECLRFQQTKFIQCAAVLVTDGTPTLCNGDPAFLNQIVADGLAQGIKTFALGLPGSNIQALDGLAMAGGTGKAVDVSAGPAAFIAALNNIRATVSVGTALPCQWKIPPPPEGQKFDPEKVNIRFTPKGGAPRDFGYVAEADCARAQDAWYFDNPAAPTQVLVCPTTCDMLKAQSGAGIDVAFGCARKPGKLN